MVSVSQVFCDHTKEHGFIFPLASQEDDARLDFILKSVAKVAHGLRVSRVDDGGEDAYPFYVLDLLDEVCHVFCGKLHLQRLNLSFHIPLMLEDLLNPLRKFQGISFQQRCRFLQFSLDIMHVFQCLPPRYRLDPPYACSYGRFMDDLQKPDVSGLGNMGAAT